MNSKASRSQTTAASTFSMDDFSKALEDHDYEFQSGQVVRGKVFEYDSSGAFVDIGAKSAAYVPLREAALNPVSDLSEILPLQTEAEFMIIREQNNEGQITLSRRRLEVKQVWDQIAQQQTSGQSFSVKVIGLNKGGVIVNVQGLRGFIPRSHLTERENLADLVGQTLTAGLLEVNPEANKLVLSQRLVAQAADVSKFEVGQLVEGQITGIKPFGLFIELDGTTGLLHIKQVSQNFVTSLPAIFKVGQPIKAVIMEIDELKGRISLSTKILEKSAGEMLNDMDTVMSEAEDRVRKLKGKLQDTTD